ncbi:MAG TPA: four helix bundle protein [Gemmatimonadaceae bacterium]|jgi:four helix bundle protein
MDDRDPLRVVDAARQFGQMVIEMTQGFPRGSPSRLRAQLSEAAQSISALLAEGLGRGTAAEKIRYSRMANGSLEESQDFLRKCVNLHLIDRKTFFRLWNFSVAISRMILSLIDYFERTAVV